MMRRGVIWGLAALVLGAPAAAQHDHQSHAPDHALPPAAGLVNMKNDGNAAAQRPFLEGLAHLHNFEYRRARIAFHAAQQADPGFALAYWGEAMTHNHPLWAAQDAAAARAALARLGATPEARRQRTRSARERAWLDAVETLYGDGSKIERDRLYHAKMRALFEADPADVDARAFYALATLGLANAGRDFPLYMQSAALLEEAFPANQQHPGILHYLIHSYDDPIHAPLGLRAARLYGKVAADAGHALHMTSHIYLALGMWPDSIAANEAAMAATDKVRAATGEGPTFCGHYPEWRAYSLLQLEREREAADIVERCRLEAAAELKSGTDRSRAGGPRSLYNIWAIKLVRHGLDTGDWPDFDALPASDTHGLGRFWLAYGRMHASLADPAGFARARADLDRLGRETLAALADERPYDQQTPRWIERAMAQGEILALEAGGKAGEAMDAARAAAVLEDGLPVEFGPPALPKPSWELLGDMALRAKDRMKAAEAYRRMLVIAPGRLLSVRGLAAASR